MNARFVSIFAIAFSVSVCLFAVGAEAQGNPSIAELRIAVQDLDTKENLGHVNPGEVLEMHVGERVRLRMVAVPQGRGRAPIYPSTRFSELAGSGRVDLSQVNAREGSAVLKAVSTEHRANNAATTLVEYEILDRINIRGGLMKGTITVEVLPARVEGQRGRAVGDNRGERRGVVLYQHPGYGGRSETFFADDPRLHENHIGNDAASSVRVDRGCRAVLWEHPGYAGDRTVVTEDIPNLKGTRVGNDDVSSIEVDCGDWRDDRRDRWEDDRRDDRYDRGDDRYDDRRGGAGITLYEHQSFRGRSESFSGDVRDLEGHVIGHDVASSVRVDRGCRVTLYEHGDFRGRSTVLEDDQLDLSGTSVGNDRVSSLRVDCPGVRSDRGGVDDRYGRRGVTVYEHQDFRGDSETFYDSDRSFGDNRIRHDRASSVKVDPGCEAILYEHNDFEGRATVLVSSIADLNGTRVGNDSASSIEVRCR